MTRYSRVVLALLVAVLLPVPGVEAIGSPPVLVVTGRGNTHADVALRTALVLPKRPTTFTVSKCGRYGGFYIQPLGTMPASADYGLFDPARFDFTNLFYRQPIGLGQAALGDVGGDSTARLPAGRYRIHLFGEGAACQVRAPVLRGLSRSLTVRPTEPTRVQYADADLTLAVSAPGGAEGGSAAFPVTVGTSTYSVAAVHYWQREPPETSSPLQQADACLDDLPAVACTPGHAVSDRVHSYEGRRHPDGATYRAATTYEYFRPGVVSPGTAYAKAVATNPSGDWHAAAAMFAFGL